MLLVHVYVHGGIRAIHAGICNGGIRAVHVHTGKYGKCYLLTHTSPL